MTRKWVWYPREIQLSTPLGDVYLSVTNRDHIYVDGGGNGKYITVNKVEYQTSFHLVRQEDGNFDVNKAGNGIRGTRTHRCSKGNYNADQMSEAAIKKVKQTLIPIINEWAKANPETFEKAEYADINNKMYQLEKEAKRLADELLTKQKELGEKAQKIRAVAKILGEKYTPIQSISPVEIIRHAIAMAIPEIWEEEYVKSQDPESLELETLGVLVSKFTEWSGNLILEVAIAALEDANFRDVATELKTILKKVESYVETE